MTATRTLNPLHFEDLEPHRFEDLVRQLVHGFRPWRRLEATGRLGRDEGLDIRGVELVVADETDMESDESSEGVDASTPQLTDRQWTIQCKRVKIFSAADATAAVDQAVPQGSDAPYGLIVAAAADATTATFDAFHRAALERGVTEAHLWTKAHIEDLLFHPENDHLLFAYFGISLVARRRGHLADARHDLAVKRKLLRAFDKDKENIRDGIYAHVLIRDLSDERYPYERDVAGVTTTGPRRWHGGFVVAFHPRGLLVQRENQEGWLKDDGTWDLDPAQPPDPVHVEADLQRDDEDEGSSRRADRYESRRAVREAYERLVPEAERVTIGLEYFLPYRRILEVDPIGDPYTPEPHILVESTRGGSPYTAGPIYRARAIHGRDALLKQQLRRDLFPRPAAVGPSARSGKTKPTPRLRQTHKPADTQG